MPQDLNSIPQLNKLSPHLSPSCLPLCMVGPSWTTTLHRRRHPHPLYSPVPNLLADRVYPPYANWTHPPESGCNPTYPSFKWTNLPCYQLLQLGEAHVQDHGHHLILNSSIPTTLRQDLPVSKIPNSFLPILLGHIHHIHPLHLCLPHL